MQKSIIHVQICFPMNLIEIPEHKVIHFTFEDFGDVVIVANKLN